MARNKYIYIVVRKWFYLSNGVDTAGCISNDDIHSFGTLKSAKEYAESEIYACKSLCYVEKSASIFHPDFLFVNDENYGGKKLFRTYVGPRYHGGFSDHLPVYIDLRT